MTGSPTLQQVDRTCVRFQGRKFCYFAGCDYFRLASHPTVLRAVREGLKQYGLNVAASRLTTGNHALYELLETRLAEFFGTESATLAPNGYAPGLMVAQALAGEYSHVLLDARAHGCLVDAAQMLERPVIKFGHRDAGDLARILHRLGNVKPILLTDGMFSHDGGVAPLREYLATLPRRATVLLDDAHGAGVLGAGRPGTPEHLGIAGARAVIQTITLSKAFGVYGGAVLGPATLGRAIRSRSRWFIGSTPLPLPLAHAALASLALLRGDRNPRSRLLRNAGLFKDRLRAGGFELPDHPGPIVPVIARNSREAARLRAGLLAARIHPPFIRYPGGPKAGYFRFVISSEHSAAQLERLAQVLLAWRGSLPEGGGPARRRGRASRSKRPGVQ